MDKKVVFITANVITTQGIQGILEKHPRANEYVITTDPTVVSYFHAVVFEPDIKAPEGQTRGHVRALKQLTDRLIVLGRDSEDTSTLLRILGEDAADVHIVGGDEVTRENLPGLLG